MLRDRVLALHEREKSCFGRQAPRLLFVSPLADGADQVAAEIALRVGFELQAVLPFARTAYRKTLNEKSRERFDSLMQAASCVLELPGEPKRELDAFVMTGRATIAHCNMLLALWDGLPPRGRGGTGEIVQLAIMRGTPVLHVPTQAKGAPRLLWSAFDPAVLTLAEEPSVERLLDRSSVDTLLSALLTPPADPEERGFLHAFLSERAKRIRMRIEYPLMLAAAGIKGFGIQRDDRPPLLAADRR